MGYIIKSTSINIELNGARIGIARGVVFTIDELPTYESNIMVFKSLNGLALQCLRHFFGRNSRCPAYNLRKTGTDL